MKDKQDASLLGRVSLCLAAPALKLALPVLLLIVIATGLLVKPAMTIQNDDDVIKFLPQDDEKIVKFKDVGDKFHGLQMAIIGVEAKDTIFSLDNITLIRRVATETKQLLCHKVDEKGDYIPVLDAAGAPVLGEDGKPTYTMTPCVSNTTSFTEIQDIGHEKDEKLGGEEEAVITDLVPQFPAPGSPEAAAKDAEIKATLAKVQKHVRTLDHVNGFLVSDDGKAAAVYAQVDDVNVSTKEAADKIREHLDKIYHEMDSKLEIYYGGSPFIGSYSADQSRSDMARLTPWVIAIVVLIILLTSRSIFATVIALFSVGVSIVWVMGGMALMGFKLTLISTSLPILLMALGSAYSIHLINAMLARLDSGMSRKDAMRDALIHTGPPVIVCVATTAAGFFSFLAMDVDPMVEYGAAMGISTIIIMLVTFWVVTSACILLPIKPQKGGRAPAWALNLIKKGAEGVYKKGYIAAIVVAILAIGAGFFASRVETHGDNSSLFAPGSLPVRADDFMNDNFGGANFIQTEINADVSSPLVLRQVERMTAYIKSHERIAGIQSISDVVLLVGSSMGDGTHITENYKQAKNLTALAYSNDASVAMELSMCSCETPAKNGICLPECVSPKDGSCLTTCSPDMNWRHSLMQIRVAGKDLEEGAQLADDFQEAMKPIFAPRIAVPRALVRDNAKVQKVERDEMAEHLQWIYTAYMHRNAPETGKPFVTKPLDRATIDAAVFNYSVAPERADIRKALNINLFADPDNAFVVLDYEKANLEAMTDAVFQAIRNNTYNEDFLYSLIAPVVDEEEEDDPVFIRKGVSFVHKQILDVEVEKNRNERAAKLFAMTGVNPSVKFDELVKSAIWSLDDQNVFLPKNEFPELADIAVEFHSDEIAERILSAANTANATTREAFDAILGEQLFDVAAIYDYDKSKLNRAALADFLTNGKQNGTLTREALAAELHKAAKFGEDIEVIPSGYPIIYRAMNASVVHNQIVSLGYSFLMVLICLILFTMSLHTGFISIIPAVMTVLMTFGIMGLLGLGLDVGSSMIAAISLSVGIDYACHLIWKFGRPAKTAEACKAASDHMIETTGWGVVINALEIGLGLAVLYFGDLLPMRNFGVLTGVAMIVSAIASLLLLSGLMRWARMHSSRKDVRSGEGMEEHKEETVEENVETAPDVQTA